MYHHCLYCSADLGHNDSVETLPIGRRLAFDATKGRLWIVCPRCRRWNLTPIEERWEPVEDMERQFRESKQRVQSDNIGVAKVPGGTTLIRVGEALPGELAAWRYGRELTRRRRVWNGLLWAGTALGVAASPLPLALNLTVLTPWIAGYSAALARRRRRPAYLVQPDASPTGQALLLRNCDLDFATLTADASGSQLTVPVPRLGAWIRWLDGFRRPAEDAALVTVDGAAASRLAARAMVQSNYSGASRRQIAEAVRLLERRGTAEEYVQRLASRGARLTATQRGASLGQPLAGLGTAPAGRSLNPLERIALEMALNDAQERRLLAGELAQLEEDWREAEMLAAIADALPDEVPEATPTGVVSLVE